MGFGDFTPSAGGRAKPITKKQLQKIQEGFLHADEIARIAREKEAIEKKSAQAELDNLLDEM